LIPVPISQPPRLEAGKLTVPFGNYQYQNTLGPQSSGSIYNPPVQGNYGMGRSGS
jgi:hypothetical protein